METTTPFDLNHAIQLWRDGLAQSPAIRAENLDELETHLRDSVAALQSRGLTAEEAFLIANKRVGSGAVLGKEFGKVNAVNVWVDRCLWGLVMMQLWVIVLMLGMIANQGAVVFCNFVSGEHNSVYAVSTSGILAILPFLFTALILWRMISKQETWLGRALEKLAVSPIALSATLFCATSMVEVGYALLLHLTYSGAGNVVKVEYSYLPSMFSGLVMAVLIFLLARKRLLRIA